MVSKAQVFIAVAFGLVGLLYQIETDTRTWEATEYANIYASPEQMERFITNPDSVEKWFHWVSTFKAADSRPLGVGKKYQAIYNVSLLGEYVTLLKMVEYKANSLIVLESSNFLKPRFVIKMEEGERKTTRLTFRLRYRRSSALFQWTVAPFLWLLTSQQLQYSLFMLRMMFPFWRWEDTSHSPVMATIQLFSSVWVRCLSCTVYAPDFIYLMCTPQLPCLSWYTSLELTFFPNCLFPTIIFYI